MQDLFKVAGQVENGVWKKWRMPELTSLSTEFVLLSQELAQLTDRRLPRGKVFPLAAVLGLTVLALMCGYRS